MKVSIQKNKNYTRDDLKQALFEMVLGRMSQNEAFRTYCVPKMTLSDHMNKTVDGTERALKGLKEQYQQQKKVFQCAPKGSDRAKAVSDSMERLEALVRPTIDHLLKGKQIRNVEKMKTLHKSNRLLSDNDNLLARSLHENAAKAGVPFTTQETEKVLGFLISSREELEDMTDAADVQVGSKCVSAFFKENKSHLKQRAASGIDPQRAKKATEEVREAMFEKLDALVKLLHKMDKCPYPDAASLPAECWANMDEFSADPTKHRPKVTVPIDYERAQQQTPGGDKTPFHVSVALFTKATGLYSAAKEDRTGAIPSAVIHATGSEMRDPEDLSDLYIRGMGEQREGQTDREAYETNELGIKIYGTKSGSMTKECFKPFTEHIIYHTYLSEGYTETHAREIAEGKKEVDYKFRMILTIDGHSSRWNLDAVRQLMQHGIFCFYLPSHTSTWTQANDNGTNISLHSKINDAVSSARRSSQKFTQSDFNQVFFKCVKKHIDIEHSALADSRYGFNVTTRSYAKTGFFPFNPLSVASKAAIYEFSALNTEVHPILRRQYQPIVKPGDEVSQLTDTERDVLLNETHVGVFDDDKSKLLTAAVKQCHTVLWKWRKAYSEMRDKVTREYEESGDENLTQFTCAQKQKLTSIKPETFATEKSELVAVKLFDFRLCNINTLKKAVPLTQEERRVARAEKMLRATQICKCVNLVKRDERGNELATGSATRISQNEFELSLVFNSTISKSTLSLTDLLDTKAFDIRDGGKRKVDTHAIMERLRKREQREKKRERDESVERGQILARAAREEMYREEFQKLRDNAQTLTFEQFKETANKIASPFLYHHEGNDISVGHHKHEFAYVDKLTLSLLGKCVFSYDQAQEKYEKEKERERQEKEKQKKTSDKNKASKKKRTNTDGTPHSSALQPRKRQKQSHVTAMASDGLLAEMDLGDSYRNNACSEREKELKPQIMVMERDISSINNSLKGFDTWKQKVAKKKCSVKEYWHLLEEFVHAIDVHRLRSFFDPGLKQTKDWSKDQYLVFLRDKFTSKEAVDQQVTTLSTKRDRLLAEKARLCSNFQHVGREDDELEEEWENADTLGSDDNSQD